MSNHLIFVYGTLKRGGGNHHFLQDDRIVKFVGEFTTEPHYRLYSWHGLPCLVKYRKGNSIKGEVYEVDDDTLQVLDDLEGTLYTKEPIQVKSLEGVEAYIFNRPITNEFHNLGSEFKFQKGERNENSVSGLHHV